MLVECQASHLEIGPRPAAPRPSPQVPSRRPALPTFKSINSPSRETEWINHRSPYRQQACTTSAARSQASAITSTSSQKAVSRPPPPQLERVDSIHQGLMAQRLASPVTESKHQLGENASYQFCLLRVQLSLRESIRANDQST